MHKAIVFHVADDRFDRITSIQFTPDAARHTTLLSCFEYLNIRHVVTAITQIAYST